MDWIKILIISLSLLLSSYGLSKNRKDSQAQFHSSYTGEQTQTQHQSLSQKEVRKVQARLNQQGHTLKIDGILGPKTTAALRVFQEKNHLVANGEITIPTLETLGLQSPQYNDAQKQTRQPASIQTPNTLDVEEDDQRFRKELREEDFDNQEPDPQELDVDTPINSSPIDNY